jgi:biotin carboxylase
MGHLVFVETTSLGVQAIEYAKRAGHTVTYLFSELYGFTAPAAVRQRARRLADNVAEVPDMRVPGAPAAALRSLQIQPGSIDAVLSTLAFCAEPAAELAVATRARGTSTGGLAAAQDKGRCREILRNEGIPSLDFEVVTDLPQALAAASRIGYPVILKPVLGMGKVATAAAVSPDEIQAYFAGLGAALSELEHGKFAQLDGRFLVEELAEGDLYSVEVACDASRAVPLVSAGRKRGLENHILELGCTVPSGLPGDLDAELCEYAGLVCQALGLDLGIFHVEVMLTAGGFRLIEANPRITGGALPDSISAVADRNLFEILVDLFLGEPAPSPLRLSAAASHSFLVAADSSIVREDLPADWFEEFRSRIHSGHASVAAGARVERMRGNFDSFGMIRTVAPDGSTADQQCAAVRRDIERKLGFRLVPEDLAKTRQHSNG